MREIWDPKTYDDERRRLVPCFDAFYGTSAELVARSVPPYPRILDLGAGTGLLSALVAQRARPKELHLIDVSAAMLQRAQLRLVGLRLQTISQSLTAPLPAGPYEAVISALAIHHLDDDQKRDLFL